MIVRLRYKFRSVKKAQPILDPNRISLESGALFQSHNPVLFSVAGFGKHHHIVEDSSSSEFSCVRKRGWCRAI
jgi:hypothetical protein